MEGLLPVTLLYGGNLAGFGDAVWGSEGCPRPDSVSASHCQCDVTSRPQFPVLENGHNNSTSQTLRTWQSSCFALAVVVGVIIVQRGHNPSV